MSNNEAVQNPQDCPEFEEDELNGPELPQVKYTSREFIKYRPKMLDGPINYDILMDINPTSQTYDGIVKITFNIKNLMANEYLHVDFIGLINFLQFNNEFVPKEDLYEYMCVFNQGVFFRVPRRFLKMGENIFVISFTSIFTNKSEGLYRHIFDRMDTGGIFDEPIIYTQGEPNYTQKIFPCFAQLDLRNNFKLSIIRKASVKAVSNTFIEETYDFAKIERRQDALTYFSELFQILNVEGQQFQQHLIAARGEVQQDKFERLNQPVSYNLLFFAVGDITGVTDEYKNKERTVPLGIYCHTPRYDLIKKKQDYYFRIQKLGLAFYEDFFGILYPFVKYEQIFLPNFTFNAMENPGMVSILDKNFAPYMESIYQLINRDRMFQHEMGHMWLGNICSIEWWNDLYIKEGFDEYICHLALEYLVEQCEPGTWPFENRIWANLWMRGSEGLKIDLLCENGNHPLCNMADSDKDLIQYYGPCTYRKGSLVARHMSHLFGLDVFKACMAKQVQKSAWGNFNSDTLFGIFADHLKSQGQDENVKILQNFKEEFIMETNAPIITVKSVYYEREKEYLRIELKSYGIKKYVPVFIEVWDQNCNVVFEDKIPLRPDNLEKTLEYTNLKLPEKFIVMLNPKGIFCKIIKNRSILLLANTGSGDNQPVIRLLRSMDSKSKIS